MIKVLQVGGCDATFGGIERLILDIYRRIDKSKIQFDFLSPEISAYELYRNDIEKMGGTIFTVGISRDSFFKKIRYIFKLYAFLKKHNYDIVHVNTGAFFFSFQVCLISKLCGIKRIIVHSHSIPHIKKLKRLLIILLNPLYRYLATDYLSCSNDASRSLFTNRFINKGKVRIIRNGINVDNFLYNVDDRFKIRNEYNIDEDAILYGHVGRIHEDKNHLFLIEVFKELLSKQENSFLIIVGDGPDSKKVKNFAKELKVDKNIIFTGLQKEVSKYLNAMDCLIFPSYREGLGISLIEAQTAGLYCVCSKGVPKEAKISNNIKYLDLAIGPRRWADVILNINYKKIDRFSSSINAIKNGYDINNVAKEIEDLYLKGK